MKHWLIERHGGSEVLQVVQGELPKPGPHEALVRMRAVGLNHLDVWVRKGVPGHRFPLPLIPGSDGAGVIESFGGKEARELALANGLSEGSEVVISPGESCGTCPQCLSEMEPLCRNYRIHGESSPGCATECMVVPVRGLLAKPNTLSFAEAAAIPIPFLTAWTMVVRRAQLKAGEIILIHAGGSGVSIAATQIAKNLGATVITTVGDESKVEKTRGQGADHVILYKKTPFREELKKILLGYGKKGADVVIDHVGQETFAESLKALTWGGRLATCGATSGGSAELDLKALFFKNISIFGVTMGTQSDLKKILALAGEGKLRAVIDQVGKFADYPRMLERLESRRGFGKVVVECSY